MTDKPTYEEMEARIRHLESELSKRDEQDKIVRVLSEEFVRLADRSQNALYQFDIESQTFTFFNKLFLALYGTQKNGVKNLSLEGAYSKIHYEDRESLKQAIQESLETGKHSGECVYRLTDAEQRTCWMQDQWTVSRDESGAPIAIEGVIRDITSTKEAEQEINRAIHAAFIGCYLIQDGNFLYFNDEFTRITGYSKDELPHIPPLNIVHEDYRAQVHQNAVETLKGVRSTPYEFCIVDKHGTVKWIIEAVTSVQHRERRAVMGYFMDITQNKKAEEDRKEKEKLQAILELAGAVSHELSSPLQVVLLGSKKLAEGKLDAPVRDDFRKLVAANIGKLVEITNKIQRITQYQTKDYVQGKKIFDIDAASK